MSPMLRAPSTRFSLASVIWSRQRCCTPSSTSCGELILTSRRCGSSPAVLAPTGLRSTSVAASSGVLLASVIRSRRRCPTRSRVSCDEPIVTLGRRGLLPVLLLLPLLPVLMLPLLSPVLMLPLLPPVLMLSFLSPVSVDVVLESLEAPSGEARAAGQPTIHAVPTPNATASAPTRPTNWL